MMESVPERKGRIKIQKCLSIIYPIKNLQKNLAFQQMLEKH